MMIDPDDPILPEETTLIGPPAPIENPTLASEERKPDQDTEE